MNEERFKSTIAVLTALVTVLGATAACFASGAVSRAADADFDGLTASIRSQKAEIINQIYAYEHYRAFTSYVRYDQLGILMYDPDADPETDLRNGATQRELWGAAGGIQGTFFNTRYVNSDGQYDLTRELQEEFAKDAQDDDLDSTYHFEESDRMRRQSSFLTGTMILFAVSFWFLTLAQATEKMIKYVWAVIGVLVGIAGIVGILIGRLLL